MHSSSPRRSAGCRSRKRARQSGAAPAARPVPVPGRRKRTTAAFRLPGGGPRRPGPAGPACRPCCRNTAPRSRRRDAELRAVRAAVQVRRDRLRVDPVRQQHGAGGLHALSRPAPACAQKWWKRGRSGASASARRGRRRGAARRPEQAQLERGVHFIVLHVQPGASAAQPGGQPCRGRAEQRRLDHQDDVGRPAAARSRLGRLDRAKLARCSRRLTPPGRAGTHNGAAH